MGAIKPSCRACGYWVVPYGNLYLTDGECRKRAPVIVTYAPSYRTNSGCFPVTDEKIWCGDFAEKMTPDP